MSELFESIMKAFIEIGKIENRPDVVKQAEEYLKEHKAEKEDAVE